MTPPSASAIAWAASGAMALTGRDGGPPLVAPDDVVDHIRALGEPIGVDALVLLGERAAAMRLTRLGDTSCGRAARLLPAADGWLAVNLPRDDDLAAIPAWLGAGDPGPFPWAFLRGARRALERRGRRTGGAPRPSRRRRRRGRRGRAGRRHGGRRRGPLPRAPKVVDLSSLWAGPLCARLLVERGAEVVQVESASRPDGARLGPRDFYERLHRGTTGRVFDFSTVHGHAELVALLRAADVVIEGSRPRALRQLGIDAEALVAAGGPRVWVSITGHGRSSDRVAFGDDAAAAGGLVAWPDDDGGPCFVADAVADPLTGVAAAAAVTAALDRGGRWVLDVAMARVAATVAGSSTSPWRPDERLVAHPPAPGQ